MKLCRQISTRSPQSGSGVITQSGCLVSGQEKRALTGARRPNKWQIDRTLRQPLFLTYALPANLVKLENSDK